MTSVNPSFDSVTLPESIVQVAPLPETVMSPLSPSDTVAVITKFPDPRILLLLIVLMFVPDTKVACLEVSVGWIWSALAIVDNVPTDTAPFALMFVVLVSNDLLNAVFFVNAGSSVKLPDDNILLPFIVLIELHCAVPAALYERI